MNAGATTVCEGATESAQDRIRRLQREGDRLREELAEAKEDGDESATFLSQANDELFALKADASRLRGALRTLAWRYEGPHKPGCWCQKSPILTGEHDARCIEIRAALASFEAVGTERTTTTDAGEPG